MWKLSLHDAVSFSVVLIVKLPEICTFTFIRHLELSCFSRDEFGSISCANVYWNCMIEEVHKKEFTINPFLYGPISLPTNQPSVDYARSFL